MAGHSEKQLEAGVQFGQLEIIEEVEDYYRCRCRKCGSDSVTVSGAALRSGNARACWDCRQLATMTPEKRTLLAFRQRLGMSAEPLPIGWVA